MKNVNMRKSNLNRILYLRTFKDTAFDHMLITSLAMIIASLGRLVVLGSRDDEINLQAQWKKRFGDNLAFSDHIDYAQSDDSQWRRLVHQEIGKADCILLFMEAKGRKFPRLRPPKIGKGMFQDYFMAQPLQQSTGSGLLHEIVYLERLKKVKRTVVLCEVKNASHIAHLINQSHSVWPAVGNAMVMTGRRPRMLLPHFSAFDMQVGNLHNTAGVIAFRHNELKNPHSQFSTILKATVERICSKPRARRGLGLGASEILLGRSNKPRRLPPDGARKIIQFTNVEDIVRIPPHELVEVSHNEVFNLLNNEASAQGCPYCKQPLVRIFFTFPDCIGAPMMNLSKAGASIATVG